METNPVLERLPKHLHDLAVEQPYNEYTPQDHAVWRYVMRRNVSYLSKVAHESYVEGLKKTGISIEHIPHIDEMNQALGRLGWGAITVDGFIPPSAFMELQGCNVLPIAADIRSIDQINYTPAPDIIHEAAGHLPIIADNSYAQYLNYIGGLGAKAFSSALNNDTYEAIRHLSIVKADPYSRPEDVLEAEMRLAQLLQKTEPPSEMTRIRNLHWWTVEYGLIGDLRKPKIYGAGLLSSIGESSHCLQEGVKKLPYTLEAMNYDFDITKEQPQLFVTPDFQHLTAVLREFERSMALANGGLGALEKAIGSGSTATCVYSSGLQVSGIFKEVLSAGKLPVYLRTAGPSALSYLDRQLEGHGKDYHSEGFGSPIGRIKNLPKPLESCSNEDLRSAGLVQGRSVHLEFAGGTQVSGKLVNILRRDGQILVMSFSGCSVTHEGRMLFQPEWGTYDMATGEKIISAFNGPADPAAFGLQLPVPQERTHKVQHTEKARTLHRMYSDVRNFREKKLDRDRLEQIWQVIESHYADEWLLPLEVMELVERHELDDSWRRRVMTFLEKRKKAGGEIKALIENGLDLIHS
jgi:phenylalanine-4-hydroxylase